MLVVADNGWTENDIPDQSGKTFVITGANSGIGFEAARVPAARGARLVLAVRRPEPGRRAADLIQSETA